MRAAWLVLWLAPSVALGAEPILRLVDVDARNCRSAGQLRLSVEELEFDGVVRDFPPSAFHLVVDEATLAGDPVLATTWAEAEIPLAYALVLQANLRYRPDFDRISQRVRTFLLTLPPRAKISVFTFRETIERRASQATPEAAADTLVDFFATEAAESHALEAYRQALAELAAAPPGTQRALITVADGTNDPNDRDAYRAFGEQLKKLKVPFYPVAYSSTDDRAPMLNLGELAKRSDGTFRLAANLSDLGDQLSNLEAQLDRRHLLDFAIPDACAAAHQIQVGHGALRSDPISLAAQASAPLPKLPWLGLGIGAAALSLAGFVAYRRLRMR